MAITFEALILSFVCAIGGAIMGSMITTSQSGQCKELTVNDLHQLEERYQACESIMKNTPAGGETCRRLIYGNLLAKQEN